MITSGATENSLSQCTDLRRILKWSHGTARLRMESIMSLLCHDTSLDRHATEIFPGLFDVLIALVGLHSAVRPPIQMF